ncbi:MAG: hypothetical protein E6700_01305 [Winkia neuii]|uniref:DUF5808 domain-containing protein n=1 Tax=Winkia neuii TaxID=33007 RepID=A0A2I1IPR2_9ACTO|nr:DUF5808 domain-containing protein [Winkia neuii]OFJ72122.1 hypothetical protein HMPREF2851_04095 [Actinomyces sp. HMSC064C12]OFK02143.1 hypothetical protein HMPREF2835_07335 [Actinomyces sp. HMSC072A03]OFT54665.1 hypothetical protein HMPREF3152_09380 [Actinomyces sp. HMSC06A08]KWZ74171.1 hypothetical protein HMPREF3198_00728 [Winkia neuii]MDK8098605.1 hypothetical protein [Winkia neuii]
MKAADKNWNLNLSELLNDEAFLRTFEPENPALFVRKPDGLGWDINAGALAVKAGLIRPDDSLGDLRAYISPRVARALSIAPVAGAAALCLAAASLSRGRALATGWDWHGRPRRFATGAKATLPAALASLGAAALASRAKNQGADVAASGRALGIQATAALLLRAAATSKAGKSNPVVFAALAAYPLVSTSILVSVVRHGLNRVQQSLTKKEGTDQ